MVRWTFVLTLVACTGEVGDTRELGDSFEPPPPIQECTPDTIDRTPEPMRRLEAAELAAAVEALLGAPLTEFSAIPPESLEDVQYARAAAFSITESHALAYRAVAEAAAARFASDEAVRARLLACDPAAADCLTRFARDVGRRAFRRPLLEAEVADLVALAETLALADQPFASFSAVLEALLQAPSFIHLVEDGVADVAAEEGAHVALDDYEIATRISLAFFGRPPDDALLDRAERGELTDPASLRAVALELLGDERATIGLMRFAAEWLKLDEVSSADRADDRYEDARQAMRAEMERLVVESFFDERSVETLLLGTNGYADSSLASIYGVSVSGRELVSFERPADRFGLLGSAGWLASTSNRISTAAARRGKYVRDLILCDSPPPPPPGVPMTEPMEGESASDLEARHLADPACSTCHRRLDPIGWGLERYGAIGELRTLDETGEPVRDDGFVAVGEEERAFSGATALAETVLESGQVERCVARHVATFALARSLESPAAQCLVADLERSLETHGSVREMLADLAASDAFTHRTIPVGGEP